MIIKMLNKFRRGMNGHSYKINKELENVKNIQTELKNTITKTKHTVEEINSRLDDTEKWI